jgi:hypothetical protein
MPGPHCGQHGISLVDLIPLDMQAGAGWRRWTRKRRRLALLLLLRCWWWPVLGACKACMAAKCMGSVLMASKVTGRGLDGVVDGEVWWCGIIGG